MKYILTLLLPDIEGGYDNTVLHGNLLALAFVLMLGGYAAIYVNKERAGKLHNQTLHSWIGG